MGAPLRVPRSSSGALYHTMHSAAACAAAGVHGMALREQAPGRAVGQLSKLDTLRAREDGGDEGLNGSYKRGKTRQEAGGGGGGGGGT